MKESDYNMKTYFIISIVIGFIMTVVTYALNEHDEGVLTNLFADASNLLEYAIILISMVGAFIVNVVTWPIVILLTIYYAFFCNREQES